MKKPILRLLPLTIHSLFGMLLLSFSASAQLSNIHFDKSLGGPGHELGTVVLATADGGYLLAGDTNSPSGDDFTDMTRGLSDYWVVKYDAGHQKQWDRLFGGPDNETLNSVIATSDGGYLLGGYSTSDKGGDKSQDGRGLSDYWIVKIDAGGHKQWDKTFGGSEADYLWALAEMPGGKGYLLSGDSFSNMEGDKTQEKIGGADFWVIRIDSSGTKLWDKTLGGDNHDNVRAVFPTDQSGVLLMGYTKSPNNEYIQDTLYGQVDYWLVQLDSLGNFQWDKVLGGALDDYLFDAVKTADGGYLLGGSSSSDKGGQKSGSNLGDADYWVVKLDAQCNKQWDRTLGGRNNDQCHSVLALSDGSYLVGGYSDSDRSDTKTQDSKGASDYWVVKLSADGNYQSDKTIGSAGPDELHSLAQTTEGEYLLLGESEGMGEDRTEPYRGGLDYWLVVLGECASSALSLQSNVTTQPLQQNTPGVTLTVSGCEGGTLTWTGLTTTATTIPVSTSAPGSFVYSVTCTQGSCSATASHTLTVSAPLVTGSFDGFVYGADCSTFRGWAWERSKPNTPVSVEILDGPNVIHMLLADVFRQDLQTNGKGNGKHAFSFAIPVELKDGQAHSLSARVAGSSFILKDSPKALICVGTGTPDNKAPVPPSPTILITPLAAQVSVPFSGTLAAFTDPEGTALTYSLTGLPDGLSINMTSRVISGTPTQSGTFVLAYSATDAGGLTNSVSFPLTVNPQSTTTVTGNFEGYLDKVECGTIRGWVWDRNKPNTPLTVEFYHNVTKEVFGSTVANIYRQDLKDAGKGNGAHAYSFSVPESLKDGVQRPMMARVLGSTYDLKGGPKVLTCNSSTRISAENREGLQVTMLGNPVSDRLQVEIRGVEGQPLQLKLFDASGRLISQQQIEVAKAIEHQTLSVQGYPTGLLLLKVNSGLKKLTLKVLKQ